MLKIILLTSIIIFLMPSPLILFAALFNMNRLKNKGIGQNIRELTSAAISAGTSLLIALSTRPFLFLGRLPLLKKNRDHRPVLMVHGLYHNSTAWLLMKQRLNYYGFDDLRTWQYNSFTASYPELVLELRREIRKIYEAGNCERKVTLIGHSLGGLLISGATHDPQIRDMVNGLITLGTPFKGSILAMVAPGRLGRSLYPESTIFKGEKSITFPKGIKKTAIISPTDEMVLPWKNLEPDPGEWDIVRCRAMGHVAMLYSKSISRIVAGVIEKLHN